MTPPLSIHIVEDEMIIASDLQDMLHELGYQVNGISINYREAIASLRKSKPDLVLLDITLTGTESGIDLAHTLNLSFKLPFIFLTSHNDKQTIEMAKQTKPYGYLIKPFEKDDVFAAIEMVIPRLSPPVSGISDQSLFLPHGKGRVKIRMSDILFAEASGNYITINTKTKQFVLRKTLKEAEAEFLTKQNFIRIHKSFIINKSDVTKITASEVTLSDNRKIPVGRSYLDDLKKI